MSDVKNFNFGARHAPKPPDTPPEPDIPFTLEEGGPVYHMRGEIDHHRTSVLRLLFTRADARGDDKMATQRTTEMLETLFTPDTVDALLARLADPEDYFDEALFKELVEKVLEEAHTGGRPTTPPRTSSASRRRTGGKSTGSSSSKASTSGRSRSTAR